MKSFKLVFIYRIRIEEQSLLAQNTANPYLGRSRIVGVARDRLWFRSRIPPCSVRVGASRPWGLAPATMSGSAYARRKIGRGSALGTSPDRSEVESEIVLHSHPWRD